MKIKAQSTLTTFVISACMLLATRTLSVAEQSHKQAGLPVFVSEHKLQGQNFHLTEVTLWDRTDGHDEPVRIKKHRITDDERKTFTCSILVVEETSGQGGLIFVRQSPMPASRPLEAEVDIEVQRHPGHLTVRLYRGDYEQKQDLWHVIPWTGGALERIHALQAWQRSLRPDTPLYQVPKFMSNTWGDRSRDSRITESFILREIEAAKEVGIDVVRIDDGWQTGLSGNSAFKGEMKTKGLTGFWNVSDSFWQANRERFPNGLQPVLDKAKDAGVEIGLWYAPDSDNELANWERDAETILALYGTYGIRFIKLDGLDVTTPLAQQRVNQLLSRVMERSNDEILLMLDITGRHKRPGFLGAIPYGNLYVQNRYTDWGSYWPHRTLRSLWMLSHWIDPLRLRFETLNNTRNTNHNRYGDNPLAPENYPADYLFASVMMSNPLGWYEVSNLPEDYRANLKPLVTIWRQHRQAMFESSIIPIGQEPSGHSWTGFMTLNKNDKPNYLLFLKEFTDADTYTYNLPLPVSSNHKLTVLYGSGVVAADGNKITVEISDQPGYVFAKFEQDKSSVRGKPRR